MASTEEIEAAIRSVIDQMDVPDDVDPQVLAGRVMATLGNEHDLEDPDFKVSNVHVLALESAKSWIQNPMRSTGDSEMDRMLGVGVNEETVEETTKSASQSSFDEALTFAVDQSQQVGTDYVRLEDREKFSTTIQGPGGSIPAASSSASYAQKLKENLESVARGFGDITEVAENAQTGELNPFGQELSEVYGEDVLRDMIGYRNFELQLQGSTTEQPELYDGWMGGGPKGPGLMNRLFGNVTMMEAKSAFAALDDATDLQALKLKMVDAGYYDHVEGAPIMSHRTTADRDAFILLLTDVMNTGGIRGFDEILKEKRVERYDRLRHEGNFGVTLDQGGLNSVEEISLSSPETYARLARGIMESELGLRLDDDKLLEIGKRAQAAERAHEQNTTRSFRQALAKYNSDPTGELDIFMRAIGGQESGNNYDALNPNSGAAGKYQIMPANWPEWSVAAGLGPAAEQTPNNQEIVARSVMQGYYNQYGNWRDVAIAWYAGPGKVGANEAALNQAQSTNGQSYPTINRYADEALQRMIDLEAQRTGTESVNWIENVNFDEAEGARAAMLAGNETQRQTWQHAQRGADFYRLLGSQI
jgi:hypothetical protein